MNKHAVAVVPFSLKDAPSLIERVFPSMKVSAEAQKERKANLGQTLTALGSYWKGRKPLILVRACVLASLLPATNCPEEDLRILEMLLAIDDDAFNYRTKAGRKPDEVIRLPYDQRMESSLRPEEVTDEGLYRRMWKAVNLHVGTNASSIPELVEQLGVMRFGQRPKLADTFSGAGSIPFEAARIGCDVYASDLNPVACMLTWGALNLVGGDASAHKLALEELSSLARQVDEEITKLGIEHDSNGNRAKSYLYCLETRCPETGWIVPMLPSMLISKQRRVVAKLVPVREDKRYLFEIVTLGDDEDIERASAGTISNGRLVHPENPNTEGVALNVIRGDTKVEGQLRNGLRTWEKTDVIPRPGDVFQERLYAIQWISKATLNMKRKETFFAAPRDEDLARERKVLGIVQTNLAEWQSAGFVPDMPIEPGQKTDEPIRTRGWTHWHHLFNPRQLLLLQMYGKLRSPANYIVHAKSLDWNARIANWMVQWEKTNNVFYNQALNTFYNYGIRCFESHEAGRSFGIARVDMPKVDFLIECQPAASCRVSSDIYITDPPYADAVNYHEIYEYFIAWLRKNPPPEFSGWNWDSRRRLAIKGKGEDFRSSMVEAYKAMADHMPDNGIQIVMFTHQDGKVWSDMAQIFWGAGLQVMADWYIATETTSELKKGGYVQGTHIIVLRKRAGNESGYADEITQEVKEEVARQIEEMVGLNQSLKGHGRSENLFNDADLQMAGYAAALRVLTRYVKIDGKDMTVEAVRPRSRSERTVIDEIIEYAVQVANEHLVPEGMAEQTWRKLTGPERFYLKMMDIETTGAKKVDNYQNFAKAFRVADYGTLMSSTSANKASLKSAADFGKRQMGSDEFGSSMTRAVLYALWEMTSGIADDLVLTHLQDLAADYFDQRADLIVLANYIAMKRKDLDLMESQNAAILAGLIKNERLG